MRVEASASATMCQNAALPCCLCRERLAQLLGMRTASTTYWRRSPERLTCLDVGQPHRALLFECAASRSRWFARAEAPRVACTRRHRKTQPAHPRFATTEKPLRPPSRTERHPGPTGHRRPHREKPRACGPHARPRAAGGRIRSHDSVLFEQCAEHGRRKEQRQGHHRKREEPHYDVMSAGPSTRQHGPSPARHVPSEAAWLARR